MAVSWREIHMVSYLAVPLGIYLAFPTMPDSGDHFRS